MKGKKNIHLVIACDNAEAFRRAAKKRCKQLKKQRIETAMLGVINLGMN